MSLIFSSIDQLAEVVRYHIESGAKLQNELVLVCNVLNYCIVFFYVRHFPQVLKLQSCDCRKKLFLQTITFDNGPESLFLQFHLFKNSYICFSRKELTSM